uniref:Uncharacterized protein n=1 Tax=viral metagenome TaxID=1070528 RepID=A0A6C0ADE2_9ZZZZ
MMFDFYKKMGNNLFKNTEKKIINLDDIHNIETLKILTNDENRKKLHKQMILEKKGLKIFICRRFCEFDEIDEELKEQYEFDFILSQYKYQYYVAELIFTNTLELPPMTDIIWNDSLEWDIIGKLIVSLFWTDYTSVMSYSFNLYTLHRKYNFFKQISVLKYYIPERNLRINHISDDLIHIKNYLEKLTCLEIEEKIMDELKNNTERYEYLNKSQKGTSPSQIKISNFFQNHLKINITFSNWINLSGTEKYI